MPQFDYRSVTLTTDLTYRQIMPANRNRAAIIISTAVASGQTISIGWKSGNLGLYYFLMTPDTVTLAYRDYGPLIKEEIWLRGAPVGGDVTVTEVTIVPGS